MITTNYKSNIVDFILYKNGSDGTVYSDTAPTDTSKMWLDTSEEPNVLKYYNGSEWVMANDQSEQFNDIAQEIEQTITTQYSSSIEALKDEIDLRVSSVETIADENGEKITGLESQLQLTNEVLEYTKEATSVLESALDGKISEETLKEYIRFDGARIEIGRSDSAVTTVITNEELAFYSGDTKVAWISDSELHIANAIVTDSIKLGSWQNIHEEGIGLIWRKVV